MAQTKKRRRRKHRGTQGGRIDTKRRAGRPQSREEAKARARAKRKPAPKTDAPPTWRQAAIRGAIAAVIFIVILLLFFRRPPGEAFGLGGFMLLFYIPGGYYFDTMMWRKRERTRIRAAEERRGK
ncbi:MAG TPA: hypothetical protein VH476_02675 [Solirubrobacterales bacterium]|jgi:hypothetical protein